MLTTLPITELRKYTVHKKAQTQTGDNGVGVIIFDVDNHEMTNKFLRKINMRLIGTNKISALNESDAACIIPGDFPCEDLNLLDEILHCISREEGIMIVVVFNGIEFAINGRSFHQ